MLGLNFIHVNKIRPLWSLRTFHADIDVCWWGFSTMASAAVLIFFIDWGATMENVVDWIKGIY